MKKRTKEENAAYSKMLRGKKRSTPVAPSGLRVAPTVAPVKNVAPTGINYVECVAPVAPCSGCLIKDLEIKGLSADLALAKLELEKRVHAAVFSDSTSPGLSQSPRRSVDAVGGDGCKVTVSHLSRNDDPPYPLSRLKPLGSNYKPNSLYGA
jgi:hypothetical protein